MRIVDALLAHEDYLAAMDTIATKEATRIFCRHGLDHALDVARIAWILALENALAIDKEAIYLAALLHDIGRSQDDEHHDQASVTMTRSLLAACGANAALTETICTAISGHRQKEAAFESASADLASLLTYADKKSRPCFSCAAKAACYWPETRKNTTISH